MDLTNYLRAMAEKEASDLFFSVGAPVNVKLQGITRPVNDHELGPGAVWELVKPILSDEQRQAFEQTFELNFAHAVAEVGRFRINLYRQRGEVAMVVRYIKTTIPSLEALNLPAILSELIMAPRGLILVVGSTGSGKSTALASMLDFRNSNREGHILTIEDPIEYIHKHKKSIVDQREVGFDTLSYANALENAMREAPDVIMIGEIRDRETMQHAIAYAETGHLCLSTLHANNANQTIDRIINFFPESAHPQLLGDLAQNLHAIISLRLIPGVENRRVPAVEVLLRTPFIADLIEKGEVSAIKDAMEKGSDLGMQTFDQSLYALFESGKISQEEALKNADSATNLSVRIRLAKGVNSDDESDLEISN